MSALQTGAQQCPLAAYVMPLIYLFVEYELYKLQVSLSFLSMLSIHLAEQSVETGFKDTSSGGAICVCVCV